MLIYVAWMILKSCERLPIGHRLSRRLIGCPYLSALIGPPTVRTLSNRVGICFSASLVFESTLTLDRAKRLSLVICIRCRLVVNFFLCFYLLEIRLDFQVSPSSLISSRDDVIIVKNSFRANYDVIGDVIDKK